MYINDYYFKLFSRKYNPEQITKMVVGVI